MVKGRIILNYSALRVELGWFWQLEEVKQVMIANSQVNPMSISSYLKWNAIDYSSKILAYHAIIPTLASAFYCFSCMVSLSFSSSLLYPSILCILGFCLASAALFLHTFQKWLLFTEYLEIEGAETILWQIEHLRVLGEMIKEEMALRGVLQILIVG